MKKQLNTTLIYVLSITGLFCCCFGGLGFILSGIAFQMANNKIKDATQNPDDYEERNFYAMNTAKITALVILIINLLYLAYNIFMYSTGGFDDIFLEFQEAMKEIEKNN